MSKSKIVGILALVGFAMGSLLVSDALAEERGKISMREVLYGTTFHIQKVSDVEEHAIIAYEAKGIAFYEKWGTCLVTETGTLDFLKGEGPGKGYNHYTFPDGSTITMKWEAKIGAGRGEGTWTPIKGTGKFLGIQGEGTWKSYNMSPERWYDDSEIKYTLP